MQERSNDRNDHAEHGFHGTVSPALVFVRDKSRSAGVQHRGETPEDANQTPRNSNV